MRRWGWTALLVLTGCAAPNRERTAAERAAELMQTTPSRTGDLELHCEPEDAEVEVDGVPQGFCSDFDGAPKRLTVGEGMHRVDVKKPGYWPYQTYYQPSGARAVLRIRLQPQENSQGAAP